MDGIFTKCPKCGLNDINFHDCSDKQRIAALEAENATLRERLTHRESGIEQQANGLFGKVQEQAVTIASLQAFKSWVHAYLDAKGIPTHPDGPHNAEGCRIGDRLDIVFERITALGTAFTQAVETNDRLETENAELNQAIVTMTWPEDIAKLKGENAELNRRLNTPCDICHDDANSYAAIEADNARLQGEIDRLGTENATLKLQKASLIGHCNTRLDAVKVENAELLAAVPALKAVEG